MEIGQTILASLASLAVIFGLAKLMGNRQVGQMSLFDYINGITIGSIAAEMATNLEQWSRPFTAMILYGIAGALISWLSCKSIMLRKFFNGRPIVLFEHGKLYEKNLAAAHLDINEFLTQCRCAGYFNLEEIDTAILETNGQISFLAKSCARPATPADLSLSPSPQRPCVTLILDGHLLDENLKFTGNDETWLNRELKAKNIKQNDIFLAVCDSQNQLLIYPRTGKKIVHEMFE